MEEGAFNLAHSLQWSSLVPHIPRHPLPQVLVQLSPDPDPDDLQVDSAVEQILQDAPIAPALERRLPAGPGELDVEPLGVAGVEHAGRLSGCGSRGVRLVGGGSNTQLTRARGYDCIFKRSWAHP